MRAALVHRKKKGGDKIDIDTVTAVLDLLRDLEFELNGDGFAKLFYDIDSVESDRTYMEEKFGLFMKRGIVSAWSRLDTGNRYRVAKELADELSF